MKSTEIKRPAAEMSNRKGGGTIQQPELCIVNNIVVYTLTMKGAYPASISRMGHLLSARKFGQ